jgi:hypothetical protein
VGELAGNQRIGICRRSGHCQGLPDVPGQCRDRQRPDGRHVYAGLSKSVSWPPITYQLTDTEKLSSVTPKAHPRQDGEPDGARVARHKRRRLRDKGGEGVCNAQSMRGAIRNLEIDKGLRPTGVAAYRRALQMQTNGLAMKCANWAHPWRAAGRHFLRLCSLTLLVLSVQCNVTAQGQIVSATWKTLSPDDFERYRQVFAPYGIETYTPDIVILDLPPIVIFRIESRDFCTGSLCLTIVRRSCERTLCPTTSILVRRDVRFDRGLSGHFGGTQFLVFPLSPERDIIVMITKRFISVSRGLGEN